jgi:hypothetical protein
MRCWRDAAFIVVTIGMTTSVGAQQIFKCVSATGTTYQSVPCVAGADETRIAPVPQTRIEASSVSPPSSSRRSGPWRHRALTLGMSDDEVLNMSGWGRPSRIDRVRLPREWREEWVYGPETLSERRLVFSNGRLVDFGDRPSSERMARASGP